HWMARTTLDERECIKLYEERIFKNPAVEKEISEDDYIRLHQAYLQLGDTDKAIEIINRGLKNLSNNPELLFVKSSLIPYSSREHFEILKQLLSSEYTYNPRFFDFATVNNNIAWYYCLNRKYSEGIQYALKAVRQNPNHDYSWETLGELYFNLGQYNECIDAMTKCIALNGDCKKSAYEFRANSLKALGKKKEANKDLEILKTFH
ncbi:MAG: tetratricopeptide repeat protein, partial [Muribaculaceae bacterium]|nr:tetratricopeptide repeat protein [Muribaculaceae bacterium]